MIGITWHDKYLRSYVRSFAGFEDAEPVLAQMAHMMASELCGPDESTRRFELLT
jgi:hypothetical protein